MTKRKKPETSITVVSRTEAYVTYKDCVVAAWRTGRWLSLAPGSYIVTGPRLAPTVRDLDAERRAEHRKQLRSRKIEIEAATGHALH